MASQGAVLDDLVHQPHVDVGGVTVGPFAAQAEGVEQHLVVLECRRLEAHGGTVAQGHRRDACRLVVGLVDDASLDGLDFQQLVARRQVDIGRLGRVDDAVKVGDYIARRGIKAGAAHRLRTRNQHADVILADDLPQIGVHLVKGDALDLVDEQLRLGDNAGDIAAVDIVVYVLVGIVAAAAGDGLDLQVGIDGPHILPGTVHLGSGEAVLHDVGGEGYQRVEGLERAPLIDQCRERQGVAGAGDEHLVVLGVPVFYG